MNTVAKYLRLSLEDQNKKGDEDSESISNQRHLLDHYLETHEEFQGWNIIELCDDGWSGTNFERPGVKKMLELVRAGEVQCIIVKDLSRFGRNYLETGNYISQVFPFLGVRFISLGDNYDSSRPADLDSISVSFSTILYDLYSKELSGKVKMAKRRCAEKGEFLAPAAPYGYWKDAQNPKHLVIDEEAACTVRLIFDLAGNGVKAMEIARKLNRNGVLTPMQYKRKRDCRWFPWSCIGEENFWTDNTVSIILRDERYLGKTIFGKHYWDTLGNGQRKKAPRQDWIVVEGTHEPIVTQEQFDRAKERRRTYHKRRETVIKRPLAGKVICGGCRHAMERKNTGLYACKTPLVTDRYECCRDAIPEEDILEAVRATVQAYARLALDLEQMQRVREEQEQADRKRVQRQLTSLRNQKEQTEHRLLELYESLMEGEINRDEYLARKGTLSEQAARITAEQERLERESIYRRTADSRGFVDAYKDCAEIDTLTETHIRDLLKRVTVYPGNRLDIELAFQDEFLQFSTEKG